MILLPYPNPPEISKGQPDWPPESWKANIACHECGLVYEYSARDVHWGAYSNGFLPELHQRPAFFVIEIECAEESCRFPIQVHFYTGSGTTQTGVVGKLLENKFREAKCPREHAPNTWESRLSCNPDRGPI